MLSAVRWIPTVNASRFTFWEVKCWSLRSALQQRAQPLGIWRSSVPCVIPGMTPPPSLRISILIPSVQNPPFYSRSRGAVECRGNKPWASCVVKLGHRLSNIQSTSLSHTHTRQWKIARMSLPISSYTFPYPHIPSDYGIFLTIRSMVYSQLW